MNFSIIYSFIIIVLTLVDAARINNRSRAANDRYSDTFGARTADPKSLNQSKRETSLSYAATNIDSKEGTRVKTITVIKNHSGKNSGKLTINPELHKNEEWANAFRDNFDSYGRIPDVPDIDDLFDFVKKTTPPKVDNGNKKNTTPKPKQKPETKPKQEIKPKTKEVEKKIETPKPVEETTSAEDIAERTTTPEPVEKIKGDAELIPIMKKNQTVSARSQSLGYDKKYTRERLANSNYSSSEEETTKKDVYFEKYIQQEIPRGYDYPKPCTHGGKSVVSIKNPTSGRTYDITVEEDTPGVPYIAPSITKKTTTQLPFGYQYNNTTPNYATTYVRPNLSVNSILAPLQPNQGQPNGQQQPTGGYAATSQRPYIAPNIRNNINYNGNPASTLRPVYRTDLNIYRGNTVLLGAGRGGGRVRGLKY